LNESSVTVRWDSSDETSSIEGHNIFLDGQPEAEGASDWVKYDFEDLGEGEHTVEVEAEDEVGNSDADSVSFTVDTIKPEISIDSPVDEKIFGKENVTIEWSGSDSTGTGIDHYEIWIDGGSWEDLGEDTGRTFRELEEGNHTVRVRAVDGANNKDADEITFTVDTVKPSVNILRPGEGNVIGSDSITVEWEAQDETTEIAAYEVRIDETEWKTSEEAIYTFQDLEDGHHSVEVKGIDEAGNEMTRVRTFILDTTSPELTIDAPDADKELDAGLFSDSRNVKIEWSGDDETTSIVNYQVRIDDGEWVDVDDTNYTFKDLSDGEHTVEIRAEDEAGNVEIQEINFKVSEGFVSAYWWLITLIALILIVLLALAWRRKEEEDEIPEQGQEWERNKAAKEVLHKKETSGEDVETSESTYTGEESSYAGATGTQTESEDTVMKKKKVKKVEKQETATEESEGKAAGSSFSTAEGEEVEEESEEESFTEQETEEGEEESEFGETEEKEEPEETEGKESEQEEVEEQQEESEEELEEEGTMECPLCGNEVRAGAKECYACGKDLTEE
ncbi:MAG: hypothetical protein KGY76_05600, partial [Candidatus Thermoplasmatota archaeon]|nr:hypothetical protein [Candidatus Thermoplasmatota archaeon]